jgi:hypothetical protein
MLLQTLRHFSLVIVMVDISHMLQVPRGTSNADIKSGWPIKVTNESNTTPAISCLTEEEEFSLSDWE